MRAAPFGQAIPFDYPDKVVDKVVSPSRRWLPGHQIDFNLINATPGGKQPG